MKNKEAVQIAKNKDHKERLKDIRRAAPNLKRSEPKLVERPIILIVCEGENTEPSYFNSFRLTSATVKSVGLGCNTLSLVEKAIDLSNNGNYDQVWCVFDADPKPSNPKQADNFNNAIILAKRNKFKIAYSNQAFEYWLLLHLKDHQGGKMNRSDYNESINKLLKGTGIIYEGEGNKKISLNFFEFLEERKELAIKRAEKIYNRLDHSNCAKEESSTTVFKLVRELNKYI